MEETSSLLNCEASQLVLWDGRDHLATKVAHKLPLQKYEVSDAELLGTVFKTGELANIQDFKRTR